LKTTLKHIASIQTGFFVKPSTEGDVVYLQAKHFDETGLLNTTLHPDLMAESIPERHLLRKGDVLFAAKGTKNFAAIYNIDLPAAASTSFFVIRLENEYANRIIPEFLVWLINQPDSQNFLKGNAMGSSIASISKTVLEDLVVSIPTIKTQEVILHIASLRIKEIQLRQQIEILRDKQIQQQIINAIK